MSIAILSVTVLTLAVVVISCKRLNRTCNLILRCIGELQANDARETSQHSAIIALLQGSSGNIDKILNELEAHAETTAQVSGGIANLLAYDPFAAHKAAQERQGGGNK